MVGLLAALVASRRLQPEPVATEALVHLADSFAPAGAVFAGLVADVGGGEVSGLRFSGQDIDPTTEGRPDLVASDATGVRLVLEAKFDAELTAAQTSGAYVAKLADGVPGALVFLVPRDRMRNVWRTVTQTPGGSEEPGVLSEVQVDAGSASAPLADTGHVLAVVAWETLLNRLAAAMVDAGDSKGTAHVEEILGLVEWRSRTGWAPLLPEDLPQRTGRQLSYLTDAAKAATSRVSSSRIRNGTADGGPGRYLSTPSGKSIWVGIYFSWWDRYGPGPVWAQAILKNTQAVIQFSDAFTAAGITNYPRTQYNDVLVPIAVPHGVEQAAAEQAIVDQLEALIGAIDHLGVEVVEEDPAPDPVVDA